MSTQELEGFLSLESSSLGSSQELQNKEKSKTKSTLSDFQSFDQNSKIKSEQFEVIKELIFSRNPQFLTKLFSENNPKLLKMAASQKVFGENAEELVHSAWETFFANFEKFEGRSSVTTFLFGILINKIREHRRMIGRIDYQDDSESVYQSSFAAEGWWAKEVPDPQKLLENKKLGVLIHDCLDGLTEDQRSAFILLESEDQQPDEVCNIMGVTVSHLRVLLFRAKDKLRSCLDGQIA